MLCLSWGVPKVCAACMMASGDGSCTASLSDTLPAEVSVQTCSESQHPQCVLLFVNAVIEFSMPVSQPPSILLSVVVHAVHWITWYLSTRVCIRLCVYAVDEYNYAGWTIKIGHAMHSNDKLVPNDNRLQGTDEFGVYMSFVQTSDHAPAMQWAEVGLEVYKRVQSVCIVHLWVMMCLGALTLV